MKATRIYTGISVALAAVLVLAVNVLADRNLSNARIDLTQSKLYTLSQGTHNILADLTEPVTLRLFLSRTAAAGLPTISSYANRVRELLVEYQRLAAGKLSLSVIDPEPFSEQEDRAVAYGLEGLPLGDTGGTLYFGLVGTGSVDEQQVIPFLSPEREAFLEHDLTKLIYQLAHPKQKVVGLITSLPMDRQPGVAGRRGPVEPAWLIRQQIGQLFELRNLETDMDAIAEDIRVLMLVNPSGLSTSAVYAIDQFVLRGGRVLAFLDPRSELTPGLSPTGVDPGMQKLLASWGLDLAAGKVVADLQVAERVRVNQQGRNVIVQYPVWMNLSKQQMDVSDVVTSQLGNLVFASAGVLSKIDDATTEITPLVKTTRNAMQIDALRLGVVRDITDLLRDYKPEGKEYWLAVRVAGKIKTAFPDGVPEREQPKKELGDGARQGQDKQASTNQAIGSGHLVASKEDVNLIVVADADMLHQRFWAQVQDFFGNTIVVPNAGNGTFVINALDSLTGSQDLISVRSQGQYARPFTRVQVIRQNAEIRFRKKEQQLLNSLRATEAKLIELEKSKRGGNAVILTDAQRGEIEQFRQEKLRIRQELRDVRYQLRKDIERLGSWMKFLNIGFMPLLIGVGGVLVSVYQIRRRGRRPGRHKLQKT